jgi:hypothetical protein
MGDFPYLVAVTFVWLPSISMEVQFQLQRSSFFLTSSGNEFQNTVGFKMSMAW